MVRKKARSGRTRRSMGPKKLSGCTSSLSEEGVSLHSEEDIEMEDTEYEPTDEEYYWAQPANIHDAHLCILLSFAGGLKEDCGEVRDMNMSLRLWTVLAQGRQKNGNATNAMNFPNASDMSLLVYDCELEEAAHNISKMCHSESNLDFRNVGSNSATYHLRSTINESDYHSEWESRYNFYPFHIIDTWWKTSTQSRPLINLTPTENDTPMIPFLQMAIANTTRIGCAFRIICVSIWRAARSYQHPNLYGWTKLQRMQY
ncbi:hypothetical protein KIN20_031580 [Parelaphostrongylus tenuis]|uniref:SCP domain-containing protein n=1 Tax=Parelaphostrongylus tenuis TaxID=148309 RepID=A0AAD5R5H7_PARTN|nr:hypothetical protein KIN20_031580 [Parelaphostrongylus tenuis]